MSNEPKALKAVATTEADRLIAMKNIFEAMTDDRERWAALNWLGCRFDLFIPGDE